MCFCRHVLESCRILPFQHNLLLHILKQFMTFFFVRGVFSSTVNIFQTNCNECWTLQHGSLAIPVSLIMGCCVWCIRICTGSTSVSYILRYKLCMLTHRCLLGKAPRYLSEYCVPVAHVATRHYLRSAARHQLTTTTLTQHIRPTCICCRRPYGLQRYALLT